MKLGSNKLINYFSESNLAFSTVEKIHLTLGRIENRDFMKTFLKPELHELFH